MFRVFFTCVCVNELDHIIVVFFFNYFSFKIRILVLVSDIIRVNGGFTNIGVEFLKL